MKGNKLRTEVNFSAWELLVWHYAARGDVAADGRASSFDFG